MTGGTHLVAAVVCVVSAAVMLVTVQQRHRRAAHAVVLATMVSAVAMDSTAALLGCTAVLLATALVLVRRRARYGSGSSECAAHLAGCAALMALMTVPAFLGTSANHQMAESMDPAVHHHAHGSTAAAAGVPGAVLALLACGVLVSWWSARRIVGEPASGSLRPRVESAAGWLMMAAMGLMAAG